MKRLTFLEKTKELLLYSDRYEAVTLFEICQLYGSSFCAFLACILSLPLIIFSTQWVALPLCFCILALAILLLFDERLWLLDALKRQKISSPHLKKISTGVIAVLERLRKWIPEAPFYEQYAQIIRVLNPLLLIIGAFQVGFIQSPNTNTFSVLSLILISLGSFSDDGYICCAGYACFILGMI